MTYREFKRMVPTWKSSVKKAFLKTPPYGFCMLHSGVNMCSDVKHTVMRFGFDSSPANLP